MTFLLFHVFQLLQIEGTATSIPVPNTLVVPAGYNFIPPPDIWSSQFEKIHQDLKCDDDVAVQFNTQAGGPAGLAECKDQCMQIDNCRFFAFWPRRKVCKIYEKCTSMSPDGKNSIWLYKRLTQCDTEIVKPSDRSAIVQMVHVEFPGTVRYKQQLDNMFCTCITGSWMICAIVVMPGSPEDIFIQARLSRRQNDAFLKPFQIVQNGSPYTDDYPVIYPFYSDEQVLMHAEMNVMDKNFCMDIQLCFEKGDGRCPISGEIFKPGDAVYIIKDEFQAPRSEPVSCISITALRSISMHQMSIEARGFPDPLGRRKGEMLSEHNYYIMFLFTPEQLRDGVCRDELAGQKQSEAGPSEPGPSGVSSSVKKKQARRKKRQERAEAAAKAEVEREPLSFSSPDVSPAAARVQDHGTSENELTPKASPGASGNEVVPKASPGTSENELVPRASPKDNSNETREELKASPDKDEDQSQTPPQVLSDEDVDWKTIIWTEDVPDRFLASRPLTPNYDPAPAVDPTPFIAPLRDVVGSRSPSNPNSPRHSPEPDSPVPQSPPLESAPIPQFPPLPPIPKQSSRYSPPRQRSHHVFTPASPQVRPQSAPPFTDFSPIEMAPFTNPKAKDSPELNKAGVPGEISDSRPRNPIDSPGYDHPNQPEVAGVASASSPVYPSYLSLEQMAPVQPQSDDPTFSSEYPPERPPSPSRSAPGPQPRPHIQRSRLNPQVQPFTPNSGSPVVAPPGVLAVGMLGAYGANQIRQATQMGIDFGTTFSDRATDVSQMTDVSSRSADIAQMTASVTNQSQRSISSVSRSTQTKPEPVTIGTQTLPEPLEKATQTDPNESSQPVPDNSPPNEPIASSDAALSPVPSVASSSASSGMRLTEEERRRRKAVRNKRVPPDFKEESSEEQKDPPHDHLETEVSNSQYGSTYSSWISILLFSILFIYFIHSFFSSREPQKDDLYIEFLHDFSHQTL